MNKKYKAHCKILGLATLISWMTYLQGCVTPEIDPEGTISGIVTNGQFGNEPIAAATVTIEGSNEEQVTGSDGRFQFIVQANNDGYDLQYSHPEFETDENTNLRVPPGGQVTADIALVPIVPLELNLIDLDFGNSSSQESFNITSLRNGELDFTITTSAEYLSVSPGMGRIGAGNTTVIAVTLDRSELAFGEYTEQIIVNVPNRGSRILNVLATVLDPSSAVLVVDESTLGYGSGTTSRTLNLTNDGEKTLEWTAAVSDSWISVSDFSGSLNPTASQQISVNVDRSDLESGDYTGRVDFSGNGGNATVSITMEVIAGNSQPVLEVSQTDFDFGLSTSSLDLTLSNVGNSDLDWSATTSDGWLELSRTGGIISPTGSQGLTLNVDREDLNEGNFDGMVTITSNGGEATLTVKMQVPSQSPVISLSTSQLDFGETEDLKILTIENVGIQDLNWSASTNQDWLSLSTNSGVLSASSSRDVNVTVSREGLADDSYAGQIQFTSDGGDVIVEVLMEVIGQGVGSDTDNDGVPDMLDADADGDGLIEVYTLDDLNNIRFDIDASGATLQGAPLGGFTGYELMADLDFENDDDYTDLSLKSQFTTGQGWLPIGLQVNQNFNVILEGNGHQISNLLMDRTTDFTGLVAFTGVLSEIRNVHIKLKFISGANHTGGLIGYSRGHVHGCSVDTQNQDMKAKESSGILIGTVERGLVSHCYSKGGISSDGNSVGGLIGTFGTDVNNDAVLEFSYASAIVQGVSQVGGLIGIAALGPFGTSPKIRNCYANGMVLATSSTAGGLVGLGLRNRFLVIENSYAIGDVSTSGHVAAALVGEMEGSLTGCFATGKVTANSTIGGLIAISWVGISASNYWDTETTGVTASSGVGTGLTTQQIQSQTSADGIFITWSADAWDFGTTSQYPALKNMPNGLEVQRN